MVHLDLPVARQLIDWFVPPNVTHSIALTWHIHMFVVRLEKYLTSFRAVKFGHP